MEIYWKLTFVIGKKQNKGYILNIQRYIKFFQNIFNIKFKIDLILYYQY
jgi:hypothetical protein